MYPVSFTNYCPGWHTHKKSNQLVYSSVIMKQIWSLSVLFLRKYKQNTINNWSQIILMWYFTWLQKENRLDLASNKKIAVWSDSSSTWTIASQEPRVSPFNTGMSCEWAEETCMMWLNKRQRIIKEDFNRSFSSASTAWGCRPWARAGKRHLTNKQGWEIGEGGLNAGVPRNAIRLSQNCE